MRDVTPTPCTCTRWMTGQVFGNGGVVDIGTMENPSANSAWRSRVAVHTYAVVVLFLGRCITLEGGSGRESRGGPERWATGPKGALHNQIRGICRKRSHLVLLLAKLPSHNTRRRFLTFVMWFDAFMRPRACPP